MKIEDRTGSHYEISQVSQISHVPAIFCDPGPGSHGTGSQSIALNFVDRKVPRYFFFGTVPMPDSNSFSATSLIDVSICHGALEHHGALEQLFRHKFN